MAAGFLILLSCLAQPAPGQSDTQALAFDQDRAWTHLTAQCKCGPRKPGTPEHLKCRDYLSDELKKTCENVRFQSFGHHWSTTGQDLTMWNIIGEQNWKDATVRVLLVAHWDTRAVCEGDKDPASSKLPSPGANDGASGPAVLLELSRVMKGRLPAGLGIEYLLTDGEDLGPANNEMFLGSRAFAADMGAVKPDYAIVLDLVATPKLQVPMEGYSIELGKTVLYPLYRHAAANDLGDQFPMEVGLKLADDQLPLYNAGVKTIALIDFRYMDYWHTTQDTPEHCSADSMGKVGRLLQTWLHKDPPFSIGG